MHRLVDALNELDKINKGFAATINNFDADIYIEERNLQGAMKALDRALESQVLGSIYFKQAHLLYTAGIYDEALRLNDKAIAMEESKLAFKQGNLTLYRSFQEAILKKK